MSDYMDGFIAGVNGWDPPEDVVGHSLLLFHRGMRRGMRALKRAQAQARIYENAVWCPECGDPLHHDECDPRSIENHELERLHHEGA